jgi:alpha-1,3-glucan synthase
MLNQFKSAIEEALASKIEVRAMMRARSAKQRFPVQKWVEDLNALQQTAIKIHNEEKRGSGHRLFHRRSRQSLSAPDTSFFYPATRAVSNDRLSTYEANDSSGNSSRNQSRERRAIDSDQELSLGIRQGPGYAAVRNPDEHPSESPYDQDQESPFRAGFHTEASQPSSSHGQSHVQDEYLVSRDQLEADMRERERQRAMGALEGGSADGRDSPEPEEDFLLDRGRSRSRGLQEPAVVHDAYSPSRSRSRHGFLDPRNIPVVRRLTTKKPKHTRARSSVLDLSEIKGPNHAQFKLEKVDPTFNDTTGEYYNKFENMLSDLSGKTSETDLCVEEYLVESEKEWFKRMRKERLGKRKSSPHSAAWPGEHASHRRSRSVSSYGSERTDSDDVISQTSDPDEFLLGKDYQRPSLLKRWMQTRIGDWPIYSLLLALGQIMAANSYQITLLTGPQGQTPTKLYILSSVFIVTSCMWWIMFRRYSSKFVLSIPFACYGMAFFLIGMAPFANLGPGRDWVQNIATGLYITASSSGSIFFALNFGDEGKS